jgi:hypothetical protein
MAAHDLVAGAHTEHHGPFSWRDFQDCSRAGRVASGVVGMGRALHSE